MPLFVEQRRLAVACIAPLMPVLVAIVPASAQTGDLASDVTKLNIRQKTDHYALAGTASDARLKEYGRVLEYIYKEYAKGFSELLSSGQGKQCSAGDGRPNQDSTRPGPQGRGAGKDKVDDQPKEDSDGSDAEGRFKVIIFA